MSLFFFSTIQSNICFDSFWPNFATGPKYCPDSYRDCRSNGINTMKKIHVILLVLIAGAIGVLINFLKISTTYDTVETAMAKPGKFVHVIAKLDHTRPVEYDAINNPNYLSFTAVDSL